MSKRRQFYTSMDDNTEVAKWKTLEVPDLSATLQDVHENSPIYFGLVDVIYDDLIPGLADRTDDLEDETEALVSRAIALEEDVEDILTDYETTFPEIRKEAMSLEVSFEANEQTSHIVRFPAAVTITKFRAFVTKELSDTNDGTIIPELSDETPITDADITLAASAAVGTEGAATPTALNVIEAGENILLLVAKTKAGGKARVTIEYTINDLPDIRKNTVGLEVSFEDGEATTHTLYFPNKVTINTIKAFVTAELAATDSATITAKNNAGSAMASGVITLVAESPVGTEGTASPTTNNVLSAGQKIQLTTAKTTPGGRARVTISYTVTD